MNECTQRLLSCVCKARDLSSKCLESGHLAKIVKYVFNQNLCLQVQAQGNATHLPGGLHASQSRGVQAASERVRHIYVYVGTSEKRTHWRRQHIKQWVRSIFRLKIRRYAGSLRSKCPAVGRHQFLAKHASGCLLLFQFHFCLYFTLVGAFCYRVVLETGSA